MRFRNRNHAGQALAQALKPYLKGPAIIYALPRGGVPVAAEVALKFKLPLELVIARKIGHPWQPEYAIGAVTETGEPVFNSDATARADVRWLNQQVERQRAEARRRRELYCGGRPRSPADNRCAVLVDDGIATGLTMEAAIKELKRDHPAQLIVAVPVAPADAAQRFAALADRVVVVHIPAYYAGAVGSYYEDFSQLSDEHVLEELARVDERQAQAALQR